MQDTSTILVEPGCSAEITEYGDVVLSVKTKTYRETVSYTHLTLPTKA